MAIYHFSAQPIQRSKGRSAVAAAAYRSGESLEDERTGLTHDYTLRKGVVETAIVLPTQYAEFADDVDREALWQMAEAAELRKDGTPAREFEIALPAELTADQRSAVARQYAAYLCDRLGCVADVAIHEPDKHKAKDERNHHAHILTTTRQITPDGEMGDKCDPEWSDKRRKEHGLPGRKTVLDDHRKAWEDICNHALEQAGSAARIDHRKLADQGIDREPQIHVGPTDWSEGPTVREIRNNEIIKRNQEKFAYTLMLKSIDQEIEKEVKNERRLLEQTKKAKDNKFQRDRGLSLSGLHGRSLVHHQGRNRLSAMPVLSQLGGNHRPEDIRVQEADNRNRASEPRIITAPPKAPAPKKKSLFGRIKDKAKSLIFVEVPIEPPVISAPPKKKPATEIEKPPQVEERKVVEAPQQPKPQAPKPAAPKPAPPPKSKAELQADYDRECRMVADVMHEADNLTYDPAQLKGWSKADQASWEEAHGYRQPLDPERRELIEKLTDIHEHNHYLREENMYLESELDGTIAPKDTPFVADDFSKWTKEELQDEIKESGEIGDWYKAENIKIQQEIDRQDQDHGPELER